MVSRVEQKNKRFIHKVKFTVGFTCFLLKTLQVFADITNVYYDQKLCLLKGFEMEVEGSPKTSAELTTFLSKLRKLT